VLWKKLAKEKEEFLKYEEDVHLFPLTRRPIISVSASSRVGKVFF
jgi:hypothetical protein